MESPEQFLGLRDRFHVIKRRRVRHLKPLPSLRPRGGTSMAVSSSSSATADSLIPAMAGEDDEDLANCLILLAQGDSPPTPNDHEHPREESSCEKSENMVDSVVRSQKASGSGVVYECKTCSRVFPSFQALGGHRASHSKPNKSIGISDVQNKERDRDQDQGQMCRATIISASSAEPIPEKPGISLVARPRKVHECSICRSKFVSGQALGGHMRRHRSSANSDHAAAVSVRTDDSSREPRKILPLDLNLPAPKDDDERDSILVYGPGPPVPPLLFSAGALVDCHY